LGWLALRLIESKKTEFLIEGMQPYWLKNKHQKVVDNFIIWRVLATLIIVLINWLISGLIFGLIPGLIPGLIFGLIFGLINWFISGMTFGLFFLLTFWLMRDKIQPVENLKFSIKEFFSGLISGLMLGLIMGLILSLIIGLISGVTELIIIGLIIGLIPGLILGVISGLNNGIYGLEIESKHMTNQGIRFAVINTVFISISICLLSTLLLLILTKILLSKIHVETTLIYSLALGLFFGILIGLPRCGTPVIKHFALRVVLWFNGYTPWNYAKFLNYATNRLFLQRVGGSYRFIHDLLRQHFAKKYSALSTKR
jgi:MFS family permease